MDAWLILGGCPPVWDTAGWRAESEDQDSSTRPGDRNNGRRPSFAQGPSRAGCPELTRREDIERFKQPAAPEVEYVVIGQHAGVRSDGDDRLDVGRIHPVMDGLALGLFPD